MMIVTSCEMAPLDCGSAFRSCAMAKGLHNNALRNPAIKDLPIPIRFALLERSDVNLSFSAPHAYAACSAGLRLSRYGWERRRKALRITRDQNFAEIFSSEKFFDPDFCRHYNARNSKAIAILSIAVQASEHTVNLGALGRETATHQIRR